MRIGEHHDSLRTMRRVLSLLLLVLFVVCPSLSSAVSMTNDPKGFHNIPWGAPLASRTELEIFRQSPHVIEYELKDLRPSYADVPVETIRLSSIDNQFARVSIRYKSDTAHKRILAYLEHEFGPLERIPGQMVRGLNQQYTWRGEETEINLTYHANTERGYIFIDSRTLAPRFNDFITDSAE